MTSEQNWTPDQPLRADAMTILRERRGTYDCAMWIARATEEGK